MCTPGQQPCTMFPKAIGKLLVQDPNFSCWKGSALMCGAMQHRTSGSGLRPTTAARFLLLDTMEGASTVRPALRTQRSRAACLPCFC